MAESRAEELLKALLTPEQWAAFKADRKFHLVTKDGNRFEVDCNKRMHNVFELDNDNRRRIEHCIYAAGDVPMADNVAAQILLLQDDEKEFKRIANQTRLIA